MEDVAEAAVVVDAAAATHIISTELEDLYFIADVAITTQNS